MLFMASIQLVTDVAFLGSRSIAQGGHPVWDQKRFSQEMVA